MPQREKRPAGSTGKTEKKLNTQRQAAKELEVSERQIHRMLDG